MFQKGTAILIFVIQDWVLKLLWASYLRKTVNAMASDALTSFVGRSSNAIILDMYYEQVLVIHKIGFQLPGPLERMNILCFPKIFVIIWNLVGLIDLY